jgi:hypothetical protein
MAAFDRDGLVALSQKLANNCDREVNMGKLLSQISKDRFDEHKFWMWKYLANCKSWDYK